MPDLELTFASGESSLSVRRFAVHEAFSAPFHVDVWARSPDAAIDLESLVGKPASLKIDPGYAHVRGRKRVYSGIVASMDLGRAEASEKGLSTYRIRIVPRVWLLQHRTNYRIFQHLGIPAIVAALLKEWEIEPVWRIDRARHPELEYKVQYGESDLVFLQRLLEEAGITLYFDDTGGEESRLVLGDAPHQNERRGGPAIAYHDEPNKASESEHVTRVHFAEEVRLGALVIRDVDFRRPAFDLRGTAPAADREARYERFEYRPGAFLVEPGQGGDTPAADDRGIARHDEKFGAARAARALAGARMGRQAVTFDTNVVDLRPGTVFAIEGHPSSAVNGRGLLVTALTVQGSHGEEWMMTAQAVSADVPYLPPEVMPRPCVEGVQTATIVGPAGDEIHTDEFGRVRVQFPWDREGKSDEKSSCWMRVNQGWGGRGYGMIQIPRVGQEVLVAFVEGDPDRPVVVGRVYNQTQPVVEKLPDQKTVSGYKSNSSPNAEGFNEIKYDDQAGEELVYAQAQKNLRKLVKNDETITVVRDRKKDVGRNETDTTGVDRFEVTRHDRTEDTERNRTTHIKHDRSKLIKKDETEVTEGSRTRYVGRTADLVTLADKRERNMADVHLHVDGDRRERVGGTQSLTVLKDQYEEVKGSHALSAGGEIHLAAVETIVGEAADATVRGPGGFIRIDGAGVWIYGNIVDINVGGSAGNGRGSKPELPEDARAAKIEPPADG
jgi:type VI secretion system secreted protein VgrG